MAAANIQYDNKNDLKLHKNTKIYWRPLVDKPELKKALKISS